MPVPVVSRTCEWYAANQRDLPWRAPERTPWGVYVSEFMLQQTPVDRVLPRWEEWITRWPAPERLAAEPLAEALKAWGRLGYPRRARWLHLGATAMVELHGGEVPQTYEELRALPGVGDYTANAILSFAFGQARPVLDTNVRRVLARLDGTSNATGSVSAAERERAQALLPEGSLAPLWSVAVMELGALVCTARAPRCSMCPVQSECGWYLAGRPEDGLNPTRTQAYAGTDRFVRGRLMAVLRDTESHDGSVSRSTLEAVWDDALQRERCLDGLVADGLVEPLEDGFRLPR